MRNFVDKCSYWISQLWYVVLLCLSTVYVLINFETAKDFTFFDKFNGDNLIFVSWLILLILPLFDSFEGFGISLKRRKQEQVEKLSQEVASKAESATNPTSVMNIDQLKEFLKNVEGKSNE